jgi:autotransporter passenger strand-loop-strand repeat protein
MPSFQANATAFRPDAAPRLIFGQYVVSSGQTSSGLTIGAKESLTVLSGGVASSITAVGNGAFGGSIHVQAGGASYNDVISSGGLETISAGGVANNITIASGGLVSGPGAVDSGVIAGEIDGALLQGGITLAVGGVVSGGVNEGTVSGHGVIDDVLFSGAGAILETGGQLNNVTLQERPIGNGAIEGAVANIDSGASAEFVTLSTFTDLRVNSGGVAAYTTVSSGGVAYVAGNASFDTVLSGGFVDVYNGGVTSGDVIYSGGFEDIAELGSSGTSISATLSGGTESVGYGGVASNGAVDSGGRLVLADGALATGTIVYAGGTIELESIYVTFAFTVSSSYVSQSLDGATVAGGAVVFDQTTIASAGRLTLAAGAMLDNVTVNSGGVLGGPGELTGPSGDSVYGLISGVALGDAHGGHAQVSVEQGGVASAVTLAGFGDVLTLLSGGSAVGTHVTSGYATLLVDAGAATSDTVLAGVGAVEQLLGSARATTISAGGAEYVASGGLTVLTQVKRGGLESVLGGATASAAVVSSGGDLTVAAGGRARNASVLAGGVLVDNGAAVWVGAGVSTFAGVLSGSGNLYEGGPGTLVLSGDQSAFSGEAIISGGTIELASASGLGAAALDFAGTARQTLKIDAADRPSSGQTFATALIDFDSSSATYVDLTGLAFVAGAKATISGSTLTLTDGAYAASFTLSGHAASKYAVFSDGAGGTIIRAAVGSTVAPLLVHAMAAFDTVRGPGAATSLGGAQPMSAMLVRPR